MSLLDDVSIVVTPNGYKAGELYAVLPTYAEGSEEITNGDFATDSDWTFGGTSFSAGAILFDSSGDYAFQIWSDTVNTLYKLTITKTGSGTLRFRSGFAGSASTKIDIPESGIVYFTSTSDTNRIQIFGDSGSLNATLNSVSVKEVTSADMDVTRTTAATRVDEDGLVNYAEVIGGEEIDLTIGSTTEPSNWGSITTNGISYLAQIGTVEYYDTGFTVTSGITYKLTFTLSNYTGSNNLGFSGSGGVSSYARLDADGSYSEYFIASSSVELRMFGRNTATGVFTNVSVKEVTRDNVPRIDYTGGGCPHILAEPQRTNLIPYSEDFSESAWTKTRCTIDSGGHTSPSGESNAFKMTATDDDARLQDGSEAAGVVYTQSIYVKSATGSDVSGQVDFTGTQIQTFTATSEWQRVDTTSDDTRAGVVRVRITNSGDELYIWGAQLEVGSYPTSYIPTSGSTVTRNQDIFTRDGIGSLINSTEGVLFVELSALANDGTSRRISLSDGSISNRVSLELDETANKIKVFISLSGTSQILEYTATNLLQFNKIAIKWKVNDFAIWFNGTEVATDSSGNVPTGMNQLSFTAGSTSHNFDGKVKQLQVYNTALTDEQLLQLTGESGTDFYESYAEMATALTYTIQ